jgi:putative ABC transport system permease protein
MDVNFNNIYPAEQQTGKLFITFAVFAIFIGCFGLFGLGKMLIRDIELFELMM